MMNKAYLKADYEATKNLVDLTIRQRELLEAWLYAGQTMGQLALRYGINRSTVSRTINRAAEKIAKAAYWIHRQRTRTFSKSDYQNLPHTRHSDGGTMQNRCLNLRPLDGDSQNSQNHYQFLFRFQNNFW